MQTSNLDALTEKIYREGVEKAESEASEILVKANADSEKIITDAKTEASEILTKAKKDAEQLARKSEGEIKLKSQQLISDLKRQIRNLIRDHILKKNIKEVVLDTQFLKEVILEMVTDWKKEDGAEIIFSENLNSKLDKNFDKAIAESLPQLKINYDDSLSTGFRISREADNFQISFTEEDFNELFGSYLDQRTTQLLFN